MWRVTPRIDDAWGGTVNCRTLVIGERGRRMSVRVISDQRGRVRHRHGAAIAAWGLNQTRQPQLCFICVVEQCGFSVTSEVERRGNAHAPAWVGLLFLHHRSYFLCCGRPSSATEPGSSEFLWVGTM